MLSVANHLRETVSAALPHLRAIPDAQLRANPYPPRWSKIEILGHLIDSASNNHQKFVRTMEQPHLVFPGYSQNHWTAVQRYRDADWSLLLTLFEFYNLHLASIIESVAPGHLTHTITVEGVNGPAGPFTLEFVMRDYIEHLKHHLLQIDKTLPLTSGFENVYKA